jgi:hypothetical protein
MPDQPSVALNATFGADPDTQVLVRLNARYSRLLTRSDLPLADQIQRVILFELLGSKTAWQRPFGSWHVQLTLPFPGPDLTTLKAALTEAWLIVKGVIDGTIEP